MKVVGAAVALALAGCGGGGGESPDGAVAAADAALDAALDADLTPPTVSPEATPAPLGLLAQAEVAWAVSEAGDYVVDLGGETLASGTLAEAATVRVQVLGAQLDFFASTPLTLTITDRAGLVASATVPLELKPLGSVPGSAGVGAEILASPDGKRVYAALYDAAAVLVVDTDPASATRDSVLTSVPVGLHPSGLALSPAGDELYVAQAGGIAVITTASTSVRDSFGLAGQLDGLIAAPTGSLLHVVSDVHAIDAVDPTGGTLVDFAPRALLHGGRWAMTPDGHRGVLAWSGLAAYGVEIVDLVPASPSYLSARFTPVPVVAGPAPGPGVALLADGSKAYTIVLDEPATDLLLGEIDVATGVVTRRFDSEVNRQGGFAIASDEFLLHTGPSSTALVVVRLADFSLAGRVPIVASDELPGLGRFLAVSPDATRAYLSTSSGLVIVPLR